MQFCFILIIVLCDEKKIVQESGFFQEIFDVTCKGLKYNYQYHCFGDRNVVDDDDMDLICRVCSLLVSYYFCNFLFDQGLS